VTPAELAAYGDVVDRYYEYQDQLLGRILSLADDRTVVIVCSDHGFRTGTNRPATDPRIEMGGAADWHRKFGILILNGPGVRRGASLEDVSVMDITPTVLSVMGLPVARDMTGRALVEAFETPPPKRLVDTYENGAVAGGASTEPVGSAIGASDESTVGPPTPANNDPSDNVNSTAGVLADKPPPVTDGCVNENPATSSTNPGPTSRPTVPDTLKPAAFNPSGTDAPNGAPVRPVTADQSSALVPTGDARLSVTNRLFANAVTALIPTSFNESTLR